MCSWLASLSLGVFAQSDEVLKVLREGDQKRFRESREKLRQGYRDLTKKQEDFRRDCPPGPNQPKGCVERGQQIDAETVEFNKALAKQRLEVCEVIDAELAQIKGKIDGARAELDKISDRLKGYRQAADEWVELNKEALESAGLDALNVLAAGLLARAADANLREVRLTDDMRGRARDLLNRRALSDENLALVRDLLRRVDQRWANANTLYELVEAADLWRAEVHMIIEGSRSPNAREIALRAGLVLTEIMCERVRQCIGEEAARRFIPPHLGFLVAGGEFVVQTIYLFRSQKEGRERIEQLGKVTENELKGIDSVSRMYRKQVDRRKELEKAKAELLRKK